ncbi:hypothetical protein EVAR_24184_1 [Eumeta japonica]|uniref:Uncharacterized protein n=1 Tax=Eumeta variegata TaxID=151549 RepID=A0A4C1W4K7_EUMVA|nr:hypothetical protein EVAR_24184_1 [Eumeta japonica]
MFWALDDREAALVRPSCGPRRGCGVKYNHSLTTELKCVVSQDDLRAITRTSCKIKPRGSARRPARGAAASAGSALLRKDEGGRRLTSCEVTPTRVSRHELIWHSFIFYTYTDVIYDAWRCAPQLRIRDSVSPLQREEDNMSLLEMTYRIAEEKDACASNNQISIIIFSI